MKISATIVVEIDDSAAAMLNASMVGGVGGVVRAIAHAALADAPGFQSVVVEINDDPGTAGGTPVLSDRTGGSESDAEPSAHRVPSRNTPAGRSGLTTAQIAAELPNIRVRRSDGMGPERPKGNGTGKTGRPATMWEYVADDERDGNDAPVGVVRTGGTRGFRTLIEQGVKVYHVDENGKRKRVYVGTDGQPTMERPERKPTLRDVAEAPVIRERPAEATQESARVNIAGPGSSKPILGMPVRSRNSR